MGPSIGVAVAGCEFVAVIQEVAGRSAEGAMVFAPTERAMVFARAKRTVVFGAERSMRLGAAKAGMGRFAEMTICARRRTRMGRFAAEGSRSAACGGAAETSGRGCRRRAPKAPRRLLLYAARPRRSAGRRRRRSPCWGWSGRLGLRRLGCGRAAEGERYNTS
jgi:hypothetical protein